MSIAEIQLRMSEIQSLTQLARASVQSAGGARGASASTGVAATQFATALNDALSATGSAGGSGWVAPASGSVSSEFGPRWGTEHEGIDIAASSGTPVRAAAGGVVSKAEWYGGYGNAVIIDHGNGVKTLYGHNSALTVNVGDRVEAGQEIAKVGSTGDSTGPHLHFEVEVDGNKTDPRPWMAARGINL